MSRARIDRAITNRSGAPIANAAVSFSDGAGEVDVFEEPSGGSALPQPVLSDSNGVVRVWAETASPVDGLVTDNGGTAHLAADPTDLITFGDFVVEGIVPSASEADEISVDTSALDYSDGETAQEVFEDLDAAVGVIYPGARILANGDSNTDETAPLYARLPWPDYVGFKSQQALYVVGNPAVSGENATELRARLPAELALYQPSIVPFMIGTNDAGEARTAAAFMADIVAIVALIRGAGAVPVILTVPPSSAANYLTYIVQYNQHLRDYARREGIDLVDVYEVLTDTSGALPAEFAADNIHVSHAGQRAIADAVVPVLLKLAAAGSLPIPFDQVDPQNILPNPLFLDNNDGTPTIPDSWASANAGPAFVGAGPTTGLTETVVTDDPDFVGSCWDLALTNPNNEGYRVIQAVSLDAAKWDVGDRLLFVGRFKVTASDLVFPRGVRVYLNFAGGGGAQFALTGYDAPDGLATFRKELTVPTGTTAVHAALGAYVGVSQQITVRFGQVGLYNRTTLGIA